MEGERENRLGDRVRFILIALIAATLGNSKNRAFLFAGKKGSLKKNGEKEREEKKVLRSVGLLDVFVVVVVLKWVCKRIPIPTVILNQCVSCLVFISFI